MNLADAIQALFNDVRTTAQVIAPIAAVIGFLGLGLMYMGVKLAHRRRLEEG